MTKREEWVVVINKNHYSLNETQAKFLQEEIANGNRGIVQFKDFAISIPYIEEFYLSRSWIEQPMLPTVERKEPEITEEAREQGRAKIQQILERLRERKDMDKKLTAQEFEQRRQKLLDQANQL